MLYKIYTIYLLYYIFKVYIMYIIELKLLYYNTHSVCLCVHLCSGGSEENPWELGETLLSPCGARNRLVLTGLVASTFTR